MRRLGVIAALAMFFAVGTAAPAQAATVPPPAPFTQSCLRVSPCPSLVSGSVQHHPLLYLLFWGPKWTAAPQSGYVSTLVRFFQLLPGSNWQQALQQFSDSKGPVKGLTYGGSVVDSASAPPVIGEQTIDSTLDPEILKEAAAQKWTMTPDTTVIVFTQPGASNVSFCGINGTVNNNAHYAWATYPTDTGLSGRNCQDVYPAGSSSKIPVPGDLTFEATHELAEAATSGWTINPPDGGNQIGDPCNGIIAPFDRQPGAGTYVQYLLVPNSAYCVNYEDLQITPNPSGAAFSYLDGGVSCPAANACIAVGRSIATGGAYTTLAESWNGTGWSIQPTPNPAGSRGSFLDGVSCSSASACSATGYYIDSTGTPQALAESWNGTGWSIQPTPTPPGSTGTFLNRVSCPAVNACTTVGDYFNSSNVLKTLAEAWNGTTWVIQPTPNPTGSSSSQLLGVSCSAATACIAVGSSTPTSISPNNSPLAEVWNGTTWSVQHVPTYVGGALYDVSCSAATACTAVGAYSNRTSFTEGTLVASWNGKIWFYSPTVLTNADLYGVSCTGRYTCTAVGQTSDSSGNTTMLVENPFDDGNGQPTPVPPGSTGTALDGVSCSTVACTAVGHSTNGSGADLTLAFRFPP